MTTQPTDATGTATLRERLAAHHDARAKALQREIDRLNSRTRAYVMGEIVSFLAIILFVILVTVSDALWAKAGEGVMAAAMVLAYAAIRRADVRNSGRIDDLRRERTACEHEVAALRGDFSAFDDGQRYADPHHPFTFDLDIFGKDSLYQRINRTVTTGGANRLAELLGSVEAHDTIEEIARYRDAIASLSQTDWRMRFIACGIDTKVDTAAILKTLPALRAVHIPKFFSGAWLPATAWLLTSGLATSIVAAIYGLASPMLPITWIFVNFFGVHFLTSRYLGEMRHLAIRLQKQMQPMVKLCQHILTCPSRSPLTREEVSEMQSCVPAFGALGDIIDTMDRRYNDAYRFFSDAFGLRGLFLVRRFRHWRTQVSDQLPQWVGAVTEMDAIVSMGSLALTSPPVEIVDSAEMVFEAKGLYHPFLGEHAVRNDFTIHDRDFYIITGANMAGKSTFLRAVGVNYILAMNGMPVAADHLHVSRFRLFTSMRTSDDLAHGISYFNAELLRLQQLLSFVEERKEKREQRFDEWGTESKGKGVSRPATTSNDTYEGNHKPQSSNLNPPFSNLNPQSSNPKSQTTLIILDEILKGTNSLDKLNGSRLFLRAIAKQPVSGIIATHDLELSKMDQESERFHNYCFEIGLGADVTYSYKITPGVARNQNATFLLHKILGDKN